MKQLPYCEADEYACKRQHRQRTDLLTALPEESNGVTTVGRSGAQEGYPVPDQWGLGLGAG